MVCPRFTDVDPKGKRHRELSQSGHFLKRMLFA
jgi:hypothetical protein